VILPRIVNASIESPAVPLTDVNLVQLMGGGAPVASGATVTPSSSLGVTLVGWAHRATVEPTPEPTP